MAVRPVVAPPSPEVVSKSGDNRGGRGKVDVVIVGLGAAGAVLAKELAKAGLKVVGFEKGPYRKLGDFLTDLDEVRYSVRREMLINLRDEPMTWRPTADTPAQILPWHLSTVTLPPSSGVGGGSVHYGALSVRFLESDFRIRSTIEERYGHARIPPATDIVDWPLTYADLEAYYDRVEYELGVSGKAGNINGILREGGNRFEAPRRREYPLPPLRPPAASPFFIDACQRLGYNAFLTPQAIISQAYGGRPACTYCGFCMDHGCHNGAKSSTLYTMIPEAEDSGNFTVRPETRVFRINRNKEGIATGVSYFDPAGEVQEQAASLVIVAAYCFENVRLLLLSGINENGMVGKYYMTHNYAAVNGVFDDRFTNSFAGPITGPSMMDWNSDNFDHSKLDFLWGAYIQMLGGDVQPIEGVCMIPPDVPKWGNRYKEWIRKYYRRGFFLAAECTPLPYAANFLDLDPKVADRWGVPVIRITHDWYDNDKKMAPFMVEKLEEIAREMGASKVWLTQVMGESHINIHDVGGTRMGDDPRTSVVNRYCQSHEVPNLFVVGGSVFPTFCGLEPTETIQALAFLASDYIKREVQQNGSVARYL